MSARALLTSIPLNLQIVLATLPIITSKGKEQEKAIDEMNELIRVFEDGIKKDFPGKFPFSNGQPLGLLDIIVAVNSCNYEAFHEAVAVVMSPEKTPPHFLAWANALKQHPLMKKTLTPHDKLVAKMREIYFQSP